MQTETANIKNNEVYPCSAILESVKMALIARRGEIASSGIYSLLNPLPLDAEDSLRQLMVKAVPRLREARLTATQISDMMKWIEEITSVVSAEDMRMIDALNVVYESWPESWEKNSREKFLKCYVHALDRVISQI